MRKCGSKVVFLKNNLKKFINAIMPDEVTNDEKKYTIPSKWKKMQTAD